MRQKLHIFLNQLSARLPDLSRVPPRKQVIGGLVASLLLHLIGLIGVTAFAFVFPDHERPKFAQDKPPLQPLEVELVEPPPRQEVSTFALDSPALQPPAIDSERLAKSDVLPENPIFESDQNMIAASEVAGKGSVPLPTQMGAERSFTNFKSQRVLLGRAARPFADVQIATTPARPATHVTPQPAVAAADAAAQEPVAEPPPEPAPPVPPSRPSPLRTSTPAPDETPLAVPPTATPAPRMAEMEPRPLEQQRPAPTAPATPPPQNPQLAKLVPRPPRPQPNRQPAENQQQPTPEAEPGYQPHLEQTRIEGNIANIGKAAVSAVGTPLGVYRKQLSQSIGSRWHYYVKKRADLIILGKTTVSYSVTRDGKIKNVRVISNSSNQSFADLCEQSIREAEIPLPPPDVIALMRDGRLEESFSFTLY
jgi:colicin import membrane protein